MSEAISLYLTDGDGLVALGRPAAQTADFSGYRARKAAAAPSVDVSSMALLIEA